MNIISTFCMSLCCLSVVYVHAMDNICKLEQAVMFWQMNNLKVCEGRLSFFPFNCHEGYYDPRTAKKGVLRGESHYDEKTGAFYIKRMWYIAAAQPYDDDIIIYNCVQEGYDIFLPDLCLITESRYRDIKSDIRDDIHPYNRDDRFKRPCREKIIKACIARDHNFGQAFQDPATTLIWSPDFLKMAYIVLGKDADHDKIIVFTPHEIVHCLRLLAPVPRLCDINFKFH